MEGKYVFKVVEKEEETIKPENIISEKEIKKLEPKDIAGSILQVFRKKIDSGNFSISDRLKDGRLNKDDSFTLETKISLKSSFDTTVNPEIIFKKLETSGKLADLFVNYEDSIKNKFAELDQEKLFDIYNLDINIYVFDKKDGEPSETTIIKFSNGARIIKGEVL